MEYVEDGREIFNEDSIKRDSEKWSRSGVQNVEPPKGNIAKMFANMAAKRKLEVSTLSTVWNYVYFLLFLMGLIR